ncbi:MAG: protease modulator HflC [Chitinophagales bacterium]
MKLRDRLIIIGIAIVAIVVFNSYFILDEKEQAIVTQFGKPIGEPRTEPGVNFKIPFIQRVQFFDKRYLEWDGDANQIPTKDKKFIFVDTYARWEITNPLQFFKRLRNERSGQSRLDDILDGETRNAVAGNELLDIVRSENREPEVIEDYMEDMEVLEDISVGREKIEAEVLKKANERCTDLGIRILDFRFKRINYVDDVRDRVYERMISERKRIADQFRSQGEGEARSIQGDKERDLAKIQSEAYKTAEEIRGRADAKATNIYANAYNKNRASRELYSFLRAMESFEKSMDEKTNLILSTDSEYFKYMKSID